MKKEAGVFALAGQLVEPAAAQPELAVERVHGQHRDEPARDGYRIAAAEAQLPAIPVGAHAVEFFADPVLADIDATRIALGEQQGQFAGDYRHSAQKRKHANEQAS